MPTFFLLESTLTGLSAAQHGKCYTHSAGRVVQPRVVNNAVGPQRSLRLQPWCQSRGHALPQCSGRSVVQRLLFGSSCAAVLPRRKYAGRAAGTGWGSLGLNVALTPPLAVIIAVVSEKQHIRGNAGIKLSTQCEGSDLLAGALAVVPGGCRSRVGSTVSWAGQSTGKQTLSIGSMHGTTLLPAAADRSSRSRSVRSKGAAGVNPAAGVNHARQRKPV